MSVSFKADIKQVTKALKGWQQKAVPQAVVSSLNLAATKVRGDMLKSIQQSTGAVQKEIKPDTTLTKANKGRTIATLRGKARAIPLSKLNPRQTRRGVTAGRGKAKKTYKGAFMADLRHGAGVFIRKTKARGPVKALYVSSVATEMNKQEAREMMRRTATERFKKVFPAQLKFRLSKISR
jgi:hypothetical protein